jgi:hypothetical protein
VAEKEVTLLKGSRAWSYLEDTLVLNECICPGVDRQRDKKKVVRPQFLIRHQFITP